MRVQALRTEGGFFIPINEALKDIEQDRIILEIKVIRSSPESSEDEALWDAVQAERAYRRQYPEDIIVCDTVEELLVALEDEEE